MVHNTLLKWTTHFLEEMEINKLRVHDIQFKGSMANYNYHNESDIDIHILLDQLPATRAEQQNLDRKRIAFAKENTYIIAGHPVEFFIRLWGEKHSSDAVYSILHGKWENIPKPPARNQIRLEVAKQHFSEFYDIVENKYNETLRKTGNKDAAAEAALRAYNSETCRHEQIRPIEKLRLYVLAFLDMGY